MQFGAALIAPTIHIHTTVTTTTTMKCKLINSGTIIDNTSYECQSSIKEHNVLSFSGKNA